MSRGQLGTGNNFATGPGTQSQFGGTQSVRLLADQLQRKRYEGQISEELQREKEKTVYLEKLVARACAELKKYQDRFGTFQHEEIDDQNLGDQELPLHYNIRGDFNFKLLEPLLISYEDTIKELSRFANLYKKDLAELETRAVKYVDENQALRRELEKKCTMILNIYNSGDPNSAVANVYSNRLKKFIAKILQEDLKEKVKLVTEENHKLLTTFRELQGQYREQEGGRVHAEQQLADWKQKCQTLSGEQDKVTEEYKQLQTKYDQMMDENKKMISKSTKSSTQAHNLEQEKIRLEKEGKQWKQKGQEYQKELEETQRKLKNENESLEKEKRRLDIYSKDLEQKVDQVQGQLETSQEENSRLQKEVYKKGQDLDQSQRLNLDYEHKVKVYIGKEEQHLKTQASLQEQLQRTSKDMDSAQVKVKQLETTLNNVNEQHENEMNQLTIQTDQQVETVRSKARKLLEERDDTTELQVDLERLQKENHRLRQDIQELEHKVRNQQNKYVTEVEYLKKRSQELEDQMERRERFHEDRNAGITLDKQALQNQNRNLEGSVNDLKKQGEQLRKRAMEVERLNVDLKERLNQSFKDKIAHSSQ